MPTERTCETCVFQKRGHCTLTAAAWNTVDNQCLHWGPRPPTNTLSSGNGDWTQTTDLTHGGSSPAGDWREPMVDATGSSNPPEIGSPPPGRWSDAWKRAAKLERRAVEALAEHIEIACEGFSHGSMSAITVAPGGYMDAAEIAAWARNRARGESGE